MAGIFDTGIFDTGIFDHDDGLVPPPPSPTTSSGGGSKKYWDRMRPHLAALAGRPSKADVARAHRYLFGGEKKRKKPLRVLVARVKDAAEQLPPDLRQEVLRLPSLDGLETTTREHRQRVAALQQEREAIEQAYAYLEAQRRLIEAYEREQEEKAIEEDDASIMELVRARRRKLTQRAIELLREGGFH